MQERSDFLDFVKGVLMVLVLLGHQLQFWWHKGDAAMWSDGVFKAIYMFHMPLFMGVSGYIAAGAFRRRSLVPGTWRRFNQIIVPIVIWCGISASLIALAGEGDFFVTWLHLVPRSYWFLWAVFTSYLVVQVVDLLPISLRVSLPLAAAIGILLPVDIQTAMLTRFVFPFFSVGLLVAESNVNVRRSLPWWVWSLVATVSVAAFLAWRPETYAYNNWLKIGQYPADVFIMFVGAATMSLLVLMVLKVTWRAIKDNHIGAIAARAGRYTLQVYLVQDVIFHVVPATQIPQIPFPMFTGLALVLSVATVLAISALVTLTARPLGFLWGTRIIGASPVPRTRPAPPTA